MKKGEIDLDGKRVMERTSVLWNRLRNDDISRYVVGRERGAAVDDIPRNVGGEWGALTLVKLDASGSVTLSLEPGRFEVRIGSSSEDIRLRDHFMVP